MVIHLDGGSCSHLCSLGAVQDDVFVVVSAKKIIREENDEQEEGDA